MITTTDSNRNCRLLLTLFCATCLQVGCNNMSSNPAGESEPASNAQIVKADLQRNQGHWIATSATMAENPFPRAVTESISLVVTGDRYEVMVGGKSDKGTCNTDLEHSPNRMTITGTDGPNAGKTYLAIFDFPSVAEMRVCYDLTGSEYPTVFDSTAENGLFLVNYSRKK